MSRKQGIAAKTHILFLFIDKNFNIIGGFSKTKKKKINKIAFGDKLFSGPAWVL